MRQSNFTEAPIVSILQEADVCRPVNELWRTYGSSSAMYYLRADIRRFLLGREHKWCCMAKGTVTITEIDAAEWQTKQEGGED